MINYSTDSINLKRDIATFCEKISKDFKKPTQKFILCMVFGIIAAQSSFLSKIARKLNESITLKKTVERLSRNLITFEHIHRQALQEAYIITIHKNFDENTILIIDDSDINKEFSLKLDSLCTVRDGSDGGRLVTGYHYAGVTALSANHKQPIPVYGHVYSSTEADFKSTNNETIKSLEFLSKHFSRFHVRTLDRGYDAGYIFDYFIPRKESFIVRVVGDRNCIYNGKTMLVEKVAKKVKATHKLKFESKDGDEVDCKISITPIKLPDYPDEELNLVVCHGFGKKPLMLITNLKKDDERLSVIIVKVFLMRWRIEEFYKFKKQTFDFENFLVRSLDSIRSLDLLLNISIGYLGTLAEKVDESIIVSRVVEASKRLNGLAKFTLYAIADGMYEIFSKGYTGIQSFFGKPKKQKGIHAGQLQLPFD